MLTSDDIDAIIFRALAALNAERPADAQIKASSSTPLFGVDSEIDSLEFVSVITDVETTLNVDHGLNIALADDRALSRAQSPYDTVATLRDYILELLEAR
jgi:acyl carrier protein